MAASLNVPPFATGTIGAGVWRRIFPLTGLAIVSLASPARAPMRLEGLDRLYFERVAGPGEAPPAMRVAPLLPDTLARRGTSRDGLNAGDEVTVRDIAVPASVARRAIWIREVADHSHPRIDELWWALYDAGRRSDVWHFTAMPNGTDNKMLGNYRLEAVAARARGEAVFRVRSEMFRPMGMWWIAGKAWTFTVSDRAIAFARVLNVFTLSRGYDTGDTPPPVSASTEREAGGRFEVRSVDAVADSLRRACGFRDPLADDAAGFTWSRLETVARCITSRPGAAITFRGLNAPSFIERGK